MSPITDMANITDSKWKEIFSEHGLEAGLQESELVSIGAKTINAYRECRLMTKFDHASTLPKVFGDCGVNILPVSRSEFILGKFNAYMGIDRVAQGPIYMPMREDLVTLPAEPERITSEQTAIACAYTAGVLADFVQVESGSLVPTLSGRMSSGEFGFHIRGGGARPSHRIQVRNAQMEIDAVFEGPEAIYLVEAKNHDCKDFIARQLYYPYRYLCGMSDRGKPVVPVFMKYVNGTYSLYRFRVNALEEYDSMECIGTAAYTFVDQRITTADMDALLQVPVGGEPEVPFPQADTLPRVEEILGELCKSDEPLSIQDIITLNLDFSPRQADYYINAGKYLGLFQKAGDRVVYPTSSGKRIAALPFRERKLEIAKCILSTPVFSECYHEFIQNGCCEFPADCIESSLLRYRPELNRTTVGRRAGTVRSWLMWITALVDE